MKPPHRRVILPSGRQIWIRHRELSVLHLHVPHHSVEGTAADRDARRVDTRHTRTVCSGTIADPFFFHVGSADSSHNTSKVTKAEGKQIRGQALTGLLNTRARPGGGPHRCWKWRRCGPADEDDGGVDATWSSSGVQACTASVARTSCVFPSVPPHRKEVHYSRTYAGRKRFLTEVGRNERRKSQTTLRQTFLSFVRSSRAAGFKFWQFYDFYFRLVS